MLRVGDVLTLIGCTELRFCEDVFVIRATGDFIASTEEGKCWILRGLNCLLGDILVRSILDADFTVGPESIGDRAARVGMEGEWIFWGRAGKK